MPSSPTILAAQRVSPLAWVPALLAVTVICFESQNGLGALQTWTWISELTHQTSHPGDAIWELNHILRKSGHFTGYGLLGLCFFSGWLSMLRRRLATTWRGLRLRALACGVGSAFVVASCDEIHQIFLPTRGASIWDVALDTSGAITLSLIAFAYLVMRRRAMTHRGRKPGTTLGLSFASIPQRISHTTAAPQFGSFERAGATRRSRSKSGSMRLYTTR